MENIGIMIIAIVTGSGLGYSTNSAFMGLAQAAGMVITGLAMFGGAKYDEMVARREKGKRNGSRENDIMERARSNVGRPEGSSERGVSGKGISYRKNAGYRKNMKNADETMNENRKRRAGAGVMSAKLFGAFVGGMTSNLNDFDTLKRQTKEFANVFEKTNYPYSDKFLEEQQIKAYEMFRQAWIDFSDRIRKINTEAFSTSINEEMRLARQNSKKYLKETELKREKIK